MKIKINGKIYQNFTSYGVILKYNAVASSFSFTSLKDVLNEQLTYNKVEIYNDFDNLLITGTIINHNYSISSMPNMVTISGYSLGGVLEDCNMPTTLYPLQNDNMSLEEICKKILPVFNLNYEYTDNISVDFKKSYKQKTASIDQKVKDFITGGASQKGIIVSNTNEGKILFTKYNNLKKSVYDFEEGQSNIISLDLNINGQGLHSEITVLKQVSNNDKSTGQSTVLNPIIKAFRPLVKVSTSGSVFDTDKAAKLERSKELGGIKFIIKSKKFVNCGEIIKLKAPSLNLHDFVELFVEETNIQGNQNGEIYTLTCVLKEVYSLETPKNIFLK